MMVDGVEGTNGEQTSSLEQRLKQLEEKYSQLSLLYSKLQETKGTENGTTSRATANTGEAESIIAEVDASEAATKHDNAADEAKNASTAVEEAEKAAKAAAEEAEKPAIAAEEAEKAAKIAAEEVKKPTPRIRVVQHVYNRDNGSYVDRDATEPPIVSTEEEEQSAALLRKDIEDPEDSEIKIYGKELKKLLQTKMKYPWHWSFQPLEYDAPYDPIILNWDLLREEAEKTGGEDWETVGRADLKLLLDAILQGSGDPKLDSYFKNRTPNPETITFETLWTIFAPGTLVHARPFMKHDQILIVFDNIDPWPTKSNRRSDRYSPWILRCFMYDWNGSKFVRRVVRLSFDEWTGSKPISALHVRPLDKCEDAEEIKARLLERGKKFQKYCTLPRGERMMRYSGRAIIDKSGLNNNSNDSQERDDDDITIFQQGTRSSQVGGTETDVSSEVMVDFESYYKYAHPWSSIGKYIVDDEEGECRCSECQANLVQREVWKVDYDGKIGAEGENWDDLQYILCPPRVLGYILRDKTWAQLDVDRLEYVSTNDQDDAFMNGLKLAGEDNGAKNKKLLLGLVKYHGLNEASAKRSRDYKLKDLVAEKGHGLVILLYGPPGVGKTSTAQTIAVAAGKPLLTVGVTDVGTTAKNVQKNLDKIFDLATTWGSVLLIDEADVFLQSRSRGELGSTTERNALVSVFLRVLEYYQGILILTTNQIAQFDVAVQSRIHIALKYESLTPEQTRDIFNSFMKQYEDKNMVDPRQKDAIKNWARTRLSRMKLDGRQIRNVITSAMGLAKAEGRKLTEDDLLDISDIVTSFREDLQYQMVQYKESQNKSKSL